MRERLLAEDANALRPNGRNAVFHRRGFLGAGLGAMLSGMVSPAFAGWGAGAFSDLLNAGPRSLTLRSLHTGERLSATYWQNGTYVEPVLRQLNHLLRDHRTGDVHPIAPALMDVLFVVRHRLNSAEAFEVISGYRSPRTNSTLAAQSRGVAKQSMHLDGKAIDVHLPDRTITALGEVGRSLGLGGVGTYRDFIHFDIGRPRVW